MTWCVQERHCSGWPQLYWWEGAGGRQVSRHGAGHMFWLYLKNYRESMPMRGSKKICFVFCLHYRVWLQERHCRQGGLLRDWWFQSYVSKVYQIPQSLLSCLLTWTSRPVFGPGWPFVFHPVSGCCLSGAIQTPAPTLPCVHASSWPGLVDYCCQISSLLSWSWSKRASFQVVSWSFYY